MRKAVESFDRIGLALSFGIAVGVVSATLAYGAHAHRARRASAECVVVKGVTDFCAARSCTITQYSYGFELSCPGGMVGRFALDVRRDL